MAIGDKAAAKGLATYPSTQDKRLGYQNDNQRGDELADEVDVRAAADTAEANARASADTTETNARVAADALKFDTSKVIYYGATPAYVAGAIWLKPV